MLSCRLQCALAALSIVLALGGVTGAPSDPRLRQFLQKSLAAAAGKQVRSLPRRFLSPLLNSFALPFPPWVDLRGALKEFGAFPGPSAPKALGKTLKVRNPLLLLFCPLINAVRHSSGEFLGVHENPQTCVIEQEGMMAADHGRC